MYLDKTAFVSKVNTDGPGTGKQSYLTHSGFLMGGLPTAAVRVNIQPATAESTMMAEGEFFKTYTGFTLASGVVESMRLTVSGTNEVYTVKGRERFDYGVAKHYELTLIREGR